MKSIKILMEIQSALVRSKSPMMDNSHQIDATMLLRKCTALYQALKEDCKAAAECGQGDPFHRAAVILFSGGWTLRQFYKKSDIDTVGSGEKFSLFDGSGNELGITSKIFHQLQELEGWEIIYLNEGDSFIEKHFKRMIGK